MAFNRLSDEELAEKQAFQEKFGDYWSRTDCIQCGKTVDEGEPRVALQLARFSAAARWTLESPQAICEACCDEKEYFQIRLEQCRPWQSTFASKLEKGLVTLSSKAFCFDCYQSIGKDDAQIVLMFVELGRGPQNEQYDPKDKYDNEGSDVFGYSGFGWRLLERRSTAEAVIKGSDRSIQRRRPQDHGLARPE